MVYLAIFVGFVGLILLLTMAPMYVSEVSKVVRGPEYIPGQLGAVSFLFALGFALMGVMTWLLVTL